MSSELKRLIVNARAHLGGYALPPDEAEENRRRQTIEDFQILLADKINIKTRFELLLTGEYMWLENRPAVRFKIEGHTFVLARGEDECELLEDRGGELIQMAGMAVSDPNFEYRLLVAIGDILHPLTE